MRKRAKLKSKVMIGLKNKRKVNCDWHVDMFISMISVVNAHSISNLNCKYPSLYKHLITLIPPLNINHSSQGAKQIIRVQPVTAESMNCALCIFVEAAVKGKLDIKIYGLTGIISIKR